MKFLIHARTLPGLEHVLGEELSALGASQVQPRNRVVFFQGDLEVLYKANIHCRTAIRILRPLASFSAPDEKALYQGISSIDWSPWLESQGLLAIDAQVRTSFSTHSLFIAQLTKDAIVDQFRDRTGQRPTVDLDRPDLRVVVQLYKNQAQVFLDSSGESLHKRGYRRRSGAAPLSETLAAGILKLSGWDPKSLLLDPMCGSGTFCIEAALMARQIAPGLLRRRYGFQKWKDYDVALYHRLIEEAKQKVLPECPAPILGVDVDPEMIANARDNIYLAGLTDSIQLQQADFFQWTGMEGKTGTIVVNPPYDERLSVENAGVFYQQLGERLRSQYKDWTAYVLSGNLEVLKYLGLKDSGQLTLLNGAIECRLGKYELSQQAEKAPVVKAEENPKWIEKAQVFANRLRKNLKHYSKWAKREEVSCWRLYNWDIPELPFVVDLYGDHLYFAEIPRNLKESPIEHASYMQLMVKAAAEVTEVAPHNVHFKKRKPKHAGAIQREEELGAFVQVTENGHFYLVNFTDFMDVGLSLDHRKLRKWVEKEAQGKDFLSLYGYTGAFTVAAAAGGAKSTTTVDTASSYLDWTEKNLRLNGLSGSRHQVVRADVQEYLLHGSKFFDLCVVDPPVKSMNRATGEGFDVQKDYASLLRLLLKRMRPGGKVVFSTNHRNFQFDEAVVKEGRSLVIRETTRQNTPFDFEGKPSHRYWSIELENLPRPMP